MEASDLKELLCNNDPQLKKLLDSLQNSTESLELALKQRNPKMANAPKQNLAQTSPIIEQLKAQIERTNGVIASATTLIQGIPTLLTDAVNQAMQNGATAAELEPINQLGQQLAANADALAAAVTANNPQPSPEPAPQQ